MADQPEQLPARRRRHWRIGVRFLIVAMLIVGGGAGWWLRSVRLQREAVAAIEGAGGYVRYDWVFQCEQTSEEDPHPWPEWLVDRVGSDALSAVTAVQLTGGRSPRLLGGVRRLGRLQCLFLSYMQLADDDLASVAGLRSLLKLELRSTGIGDGGLAYLKRRNRLKELDLGGR